MYNIFPVKCHYQAPLDAEATSPPLPPLPHSPQSLSAPHKEEEEEEEEEGGPVWRLLGRWREKVFVLLVQQRLTEMRGEREEQEAKERVGRGEGGGREGGSIPRWLCLLSSIYISVLAPLPFFWW